MHDITVQDAATTASSPSQEKLIHWATAALSAQKQTNVEVTIRLVDEAEMSELNETYRQKQGPTNVLSFPFDCERLDEMQTHLLGDIIICSSIIEREAKEQNKSLDAHWAHMVVHGILHLLGFDHIEEQDAEEMESLEVTILKQLQFPNPYQLQE